MKWLKKFWKKIPGIMIVITWEVVEHKNLSNKNKVYPKAICHRIKTIILLHLTTTPLHTMYIIPHLKIWKRLKSLNDRAAYSWGVFFFLDQIKQCLTLIYRQVSLCPQITDLLYPNRVFKSYFTDRTKHSQSLATSLPCLTFI